MTKFMLDFTMDGYETAEAMNAAAPDYIFDALDSAGATPRNIQIVDPITRAAPALYQALKDLLAGFPTEFKVVKRRINDSDPYNPKLVAAWAALRLAEGDPDEQSLG